MATETPQDAETGSETRWLMGASSNAALAGTQQQGRHMLLHHEAANAATRNMTQDAHLKMIWKTGSIKNTKQYALQSGYIHIELNGRQLTIYCTAGKRRELCDQLITARKRKRPWFDDGICLHSQRNLASWHWKLRDGRRSISWWASPRVDQTGFNHLRGGHGSVYGWASRQISVLEAATDFS